ncbi:citrate lyase beta subunit [Nakamurella sp. UYEF19]|uniref:HpcH/HpaI aldolase/citrate lyase family protein n=1 Tax=Nakamurella sp. UYEF19 TaxID=1756392 RepID=UPI0033931AAD
MFFIDLQPQHDRLRADDGKGAYVRHFDHLTQTVRDELFAVSPGEFDRSSPRTVLANALGATLYVPGVRDDLVRAITRRAAEGVRSVVIDLEDAVADRYVDQALENVVKALVDLSGVPQQTMLFVRVRTPEHIRQIIDGIGEVNCALNGFVLPKFTASTGARFLGEILSGSERVGTRLFAMPVIETPDVLYRETRDDALSAVRDLLGQYRDIVLAVRFGATDLCGLFGIRRDRDLTIYHVGVVAELISEVVNHLGRADGTGYTITGPVWEYFAGHERLFRPQLRSTPFEDRDARSFRHELVSKDFDGLIREIVLDRANGLTGKTVIHPSHVAAVHALSVVPHEEFSDAADILEVGISGDAGVRASGYRNKMNEMRPHRRWAERVQDRARVFGVANPEVSHVDILTALLDR